MSEKSKDNEGNISGQYPPETSDLSVLLTHPSQPMAMKPESTDSPSMSHVIDPSMDSESTPKMYLAESRLSDPSQYILPHSLGILHSQSSTTASSQQQHTIPYHGMQYNLSSGLGLGSGLPNISTNLHSTSHPSVYSNPEMIQSTYPQTHLGFNVQSHPHPHPHQVANNSSYSPYPAMPSLHAPYYPHQLSGTPSSMNGSVNSSIGLSAGLPEYPFHGYGSSFPYGPLSMGGVHMENSGVPPISDPLQMNYNHMVAPMSSDKPVDGSAQTQTQTQTHDGEAVAPGSGSGSGQDPKNVDKHRDGKKLSVVHDDKKQVLDESDDDEHDETGTGETSTSTSTSISTSTSSSSTNSTNSTGPVTLPSHACAYCTIHSKTSVVKCICCNKWFCNSSGVTTASHIVTHLVRSKHKEVMLHQDSAFGDSVLECYSCGCRNVFILGFVSAKVDNVVVLLCRSPCLNNATVKNMPWNVTQWQPVIEDKKFLPWLVSVPTAEEQKLAHPIPTHLVARLEEVWKQYPKAKLSEITEAALDPALPPVCVTYENAAQYRSILAPLVGLEALHDQKTKETQSQTGVSVSWEVIPQVFSPSNRQGAAGEDSSNADSLSSRGKVIASFFFFSYEEISLRVLPGDEVILTREMDTVTSTGEKKTWTGVGTVLRISPEGKVCISLTQGLHNVPTHLLTGYSAQLTWKSVAYDRMNDALNTFETSPDCVSPELRQQLLGNTQNSRAFSTTLDAGLRVPNLPALNPSQSTAVRTALERPLSLIQGPPGTGKTLTSASIVYHMSRLRSSSFSFSFSDATSQHNVKNVSTVEDSETDDEDDHDEDDHDDDDHDHDMEVDVDADEHNDDEGDDDSNPQDQLINTDAIDTTDSLKKGKKNKKSNKKNKKNATTMSKDKDKDNARKSGKKNSSTQRGKKSSILVCAPSNVAVDHLSLKISTTGLRVVRVCSKSREAVASSSSAVDALSLHVLVQQYAKQSLPELAELIALKDAEGSLPIFMERRLQKLSQRVEVSILRNADVICSTCAGSADVRVRRAKLTFDQVLIDEATQATEPESLIPIVLGAKQLILVGDHCQLGPVVMCKAAAKAGLSRSLFERLILLGNQPLRLQVQYRMHPVLSAFPSNTFYDGSLQNGLSTEDRKLPPLTFSWPSPQVPMIFFSGTGSEEFSASGVSFLNRLEAASVEAIVTEFYHSGIKPHQIGIITPYEGQRLHLMGLFSRPTSPLYSIASDLEIASVDSFQGREKDFIIFSCVRSNSQGDIGFVADPRRLNVALTRARFGLIILGNARALSRQPLWYSLLSHFKQLNILVEGTPQAMRPYSLALEPPPKNSSLTRAPLRVPVGFKTSQVLSGRDSGTKTARRSETNPESSKFRVQSYHHSSSQAETALMAKKLFLNRNISLEATSNAIEFDPPVYEPKKPTYASLVGTNLSSSATESPMVKAVVSGEKRSASGTTKNPKTASKPSVIVRDGVKKKLVKTIVKRKVKKTTGKLVPKQAVSIHTKPNQYSSLAQDTDDEISENDQSDQSSEHDQDEDEEDGQDGQDEDDAES